MSTTGEQPPTATPPGWYPDPWSPAYVRWWSGLDWTAYTAPLSAKQTDGVAVASLVTSLSGLSPVGIVLGFLSRRRIAKEPERRTGRGLANAGIIVGALGMAVIALTVGLWLNGAFEDHNADEYTGTKRDVAHVIDRFENAWDADDGTQVCQELFTEELAASYQGNCASEWDDGFWVDMEVESIEVYGDSATVTANDSDVVDWEFELSFVNGEWRICGLESN